MYACVYRWRDQPAIARPGRTVAKVLMGFSKSLFHGSKFAVDVPFLDTRFVISPKQKRQKRSFAENISDSMVRVPALVVPLGRFL